MTTYKVYYKDEFGTNYCFVEVADSVNGRKRTARERVQAAREAAVREQYIKEEEIVKIVKDC